MPAERRTSPSVRRRGRALGVVLAAAALIVLGLHAWFTYSLQVARDESAPLAERLRAARRAHAVEPWNERAAITESTRRADSLLARGSTDEAYFLLLPLTPTVREDPQFSDVYRRAVKAKVVLDSRKAHLQHAREATDGVLAPEDVFR